jgi:hypothetical protein
MKYAVEMGSVATILSFVKVASRVQKFIVEGKPEQTKSERVPRKI